MCQAGDRLPSWGAGEPGGGMVAGMGALPLFV